MASLIHGLWREIVRPAAPCVRLRIAAPAVMEGDWPTLAEAAQAARPRAALRPAVPLAAHAGTAGASSASSSEAGAVAVPRPRVSLLPASQVQPAFPSAPPTTRVLPRGPVAVPRPQLVPLQGARPAVPIAFLPGGQPPPHKELPGRLAVPATGWNK